MRLVENWERCSEKVNRMFPQFISSVMLLVKILSMMVAVFGVTLVGCIHLGLEYPLILFLYSWFLQLPTTKFWREWFGMGFRCSQSKFTDQKFVLCDTFLAWYYLDVFSHFQISLPQKNEVNLGFCIARLVSDKVTISFDKESIPNDKIICNSKFKDSITICITFAIPRTSRYTFLSSCFSSNVSIPVSARDDYFFIW